MNWRVRWQLLDPIRHSVVELLLENYHRQLVLVEHDVAAMKQELESMQAREIDDLDGVDQTEGQRCRP